MSIRVKIVRKPSIPSIDGVQLDALEPGRVYELGTHIAALLMAEAWAVPVPFDEVAPPAPFSEADPCREVPFRDADAPPNLTREHYPPYLDQQSHAIAMERRRRRKR